MKKITNIKEYNNEGVLVKETTITEEDEKVFYPNPYPVYPTITPWVNPVIYDTSNPLATCESKTTWVNEEYNSLVDKSANKVLEKINQARSNRGFSRDLSFAKEN